MRRRSIVSACLLVWGASGCGTERPIAGSDAVEGAEGCPLVPDLDSLPVASVALEFEIGTVDGDSVSTFGRITDVALLSDGSLAVADGMRRQILRIGPTGELLNRIGRPGDGPGEYRYPWAIEALADDRVAVFDPVLWRISTFAMDGTLVGEDFPDPEPEFGQNPEVRFDARGRLFNLSFSSYQESLIEDVGGRRGLGRGTVSVNRWDAVERTWLRYVDTPGPEVYLDLESGTIVDVLGSKKTVWDVDAEGQVVFVDNQGLTVQRVRDAGLGPTCLGSRSTVVERLGPEAEKSYYGAADLSPETPSDLVRQTRATRRNIPLPSTLPTADLIVVDTEGHIWIRLAPPYPRPTRARWLRLPARDAAPVTAEPPIYFRPEVIDPPRWIGSDRGAFDIPVIRGFVVSDPERVALRAPAAIGPGGPGSTARRPRAAPAPAQANHGHGW
ncbi:MAG: hypothetical protein RQ751_06835 [Longimicrobiales bacterium]|nr:hypothetical protein [Longimicrobiales bacterium]